MDLSPITLAIPIFFGLIVLEFVFEKFTRKKTYRLNDAVTNISTGTLSQVTGGFLQILKVGVFAYLFQHFAIVQLPANGWSFLALFILWDLCYYWEHRFAHVVNLFWGGHVVHHQSEEYNLSVALRQSSTSIIWGFPFYLPLAFIGFDPKQFALVGGLNLLYQFWIHTEHIGKLGFLELFMNTPSHHRVHHGRDPKYLDKNYAGVFIIWDKMFGTFQKEEERPHYGITTNINSWNPVYANFAHYIDLIDQVKLGKNIPDKFRILFNKPGWLPEYAGGVQAPPQIKDNYKKYDKNLFPSINLYLLIQFVIAIGLFGLYFFKQSFFSAPFNLAYSLWILWTTLTFGLLFEKTKTWVAGIELIRLLLIPIGFYWLKENDVVSNTAFQAMLIYAILSLCFFLVLRSRPLANVKD